MKYWEIIIRYPERPSGKAALRIRSGGKRERPLLEPDSYESVMKRLNSVF
jgi:hypothetical protein